MSSLIDLCRDAPLKSFAADAVLLSEGTTSGYLYVLNAGTVEVLRGDTQVAVVEDPGAVFGEMSVLLALPHTATVRAMTEVSVYAFDDAERFLKSTPEIAFLVGRLLARRLSAATSYLADIKRQYDSSGDHLHMVDEVLDALIHDPNDRFAFPAEPESDPRL